VEETNAGHQTSWLSKSSPSNFYYKAHESCHELTFITLSILLGLKFLLLLRTKEF
jgi:hypothetical protein